MSRYTRLERAVMDALAHDLRGQIPDLAGQFEDSRASQRRNSGFGLFTEMIVDRDRSPPVSGTSGDLGTVHAMVAHLPDPIAFKARVRHGVLLGLLGDSYGQDTRALDFATASFDQVFTVDDRGRSIPFEPARLMPPSPLLDLQKHQNHDLARPQAPLPRRNVGALQRVQAAVAPARQGPTSGVGEDLKTGAVADSAIPTDQTSLLVGLWVLTAVVALIIVFVFRLPLAFGIITAVLVGRAVKDPKVLAAIRKRLEDWQASQAGPPPR